MSTHSATLTLVRDEHGERVVVTQADEVIWIADELMAAATDPDRDRIPGDLDVNGDLIAFGTPGEGLGRLTYRLIGHDEVNRWHIAKRETLEETTP